MEAVLNVAFFIVHVKHYSPVLFTLPPPFLLKCAQSKASMSEHVSHHYFLLFKTVKCEIWWVCIISVQTKGLGLGLVWGGWGAGGAVERLV